MNTANPKARKYTTPKFEIVPSNQEVTQTRTRRSPRESKALGVVGQVRAALKPKARMATCLGFLLGGFIPLASYFVVHHEIDTSLPLHAQIGTYMVLGALGFSAKTVYEWAKMAFSSGFKSLGFVVLVEGVMTFSQTKWLSLAALAYLIVINGIATGCRLSLSESQK